jgi:hypothetical protein
MNSTGTLWATLNSAELELQVYQVPELSIAYRISISELIQPDSSLENEFVECICFWDDQTMALVTSHGRLGISPLYKLSNMQLSILALSFPFSVSASVGQLWFLHPENKKFSLSTCLRIEKEEWIDYLIEQQRYTEAVQCCRDWHMDPDFVYQEQWSRNIQLQVLDQQVLNMISDKAWVLQQCLSITFSSLLSTRVFIEYGIGLTDRITKEDIDLEIERVLEESSSPVKEAGWPSVMDLFFIRVKLVKRLRKLDLFEKIFEKAIVDSRSTGFDIATEFKGFSEKEIVRLAAEYASEGNVDALFILFTHQGEEILPYRLALLDLIPFIVPPEQYRRLLPKLDSKNEIELWKQSSPKKQDWTQLKSFVEFLDMFHESATFIDIPSQGYPESIDVIVSWYRKRIENLEEFWGLTSFASTLCTIALENGIKELDEMEMRLQLIDRVRRHSFEYENITWSEMLKLPPLILIPTLLNATIDFGTKGLYTVLYVIGLAEVDTNVFFDLLVEFSVTQPQKISIIARQIQQDSIVAQTIPLKQFVYKCAYHDSKQDLHLWQEVLSILSHQPEDLCGESGWDVDMEDLDFGDSSSNEWVELEKHLQIAEMYNEHGITMNLLEVRNLISESGKSALSKLLRQSAVFKGNDIDEWKHGMEKIQVRFGCGDFPDLPIEDLHHMIASFALSRGQFQYAQSLLYPMNRIVHIDPVAAEKLVLEAAIEFYDNDQVGDKTCGLLKQSLVWSEWLM